ncbi:MAG: tetratricopeptide repeat protein [Fodinibius sp.]|nr:tetratricopeptide repeat protein [Fodinibius sp.]
MEKRLVGFHIPIVLVMVVAFWPGSQAIGQHQELDGLNFQNAESDSALVHLYLKAADEAKRNGKIGKQRRVLSEARRVADSLRNPQLQQVVERDLGEYYLETSSYDSAQVVLELAAGRASDNHTQVQVLNLLATAYNYKSQYPEAMNTYNQALSQVDSLESPELYAAINTNKAAIYENLGNISKAVSLYQKGITFAETVGDSSFLATALNNLGNLYFEESSYKEAKPYLEEAIAVSEDQQFYNTLLRATHNLASVQRDLGNYDEARSLYQQAWSLHEKVRPNSPGIQLLHNMGLLHLQVSEFDEAESHFRESLQYSKKAGVPAGLFYNFIGLGDVALARDNFSESTDFYNQGLAIAQKLDSPPFRITASEKLYEAHKKQGNFEQALQYFETVKEVSDSLTQAQQDKQLALAETELGLRQQQKINQLLQERQQQQEARIQTQNWLIVGSVIVIVIILVFLYLLYRSNRERERINRELEEMNQVKNKMMGVIAHDLRSPLASMQGIFYLLKEEGISMEEVREVASELEVSVQQNINMMDNLLSWANSQRRGLKVDIEDVSPREVVQRVVENSSLQAEHKSLELVNKINGISEVEADKNMLQIVIRNLVNNAIKFSQEEDVISISAREEPQHVVIEVKDNGIGIPEDKQDQIFLAHGFSQTGTNQENGSGLGLHLSKEFMEKQNGKIDMESTEGEGTTFFLRLPKAG